MASFKDISIKRKMQMVITAVALAALLVSCVAFLSYDRLVFRRSMRDSVTILANVIGSNCGAALAFNDPKSATEILDGLKAQSHIVAAVVYSTGGKVFAHYVRVPGHAEIPVAAPDVDQVFFTPNRLKLFHRIILGGEPMGAIYVESDLEEMHSRAIRYLYTVALIMAGSTLLAFLLSSRLQRVVTNPLLHLADTARAVSSEKNYSLRAVKESQDEIGYLIDGFNGMLEQIQQRDQELSRHGEHLEEEVAKRTTALRRSEKHFRQLFSTIPLPICVYDSETQEFLEVNDTAVAHYGYTQTEFLSMKFSDIQLPEEARHAHSNLLQPNRAGQYSTRHRTKQGTAIDVDITSHRIEFGGHEAVLVAAQDVTDRMRMETELRRAQKLEAVGSLAAGIAHEINTPIQFVGDNTRFLQGAFSDLGSVLERYEQLEQAAAAIGVEAALLGSVKEAREKADLEYLQGEIPKALEQTLDGIKRVATIVRAMKDFSHVDQSGEKAAAELNKALESTLAVARNEWKYVADVETEFGEIPTVICNLGDINQVFLNLVVNAAHAIGDAVKGTTTKGKIRIKTWQEGEKVVVAVSDTGTGIPEEIRDKIFDPFFTTKEVGKGTGQGLTLARNTVVDRHGGSLTFDSETGKGTTFFVRLPLAPVNA